MTKDTVSRRHFLKYCSAVAATLGLSATWIPKIAEALTSDSRPPVVWLHFAECTGCSEAFLRAQSPGVEDILFGVLNLTYHETIQAACGTKAHQNLERTVAERAGEFICIVEGAIPTAAGGVYGMVGGKTMLSIAQEVLPKAKHVIAFGTCAAYGGLPAAAPNLTGAKGVKDATGIESINLTGCPPHPMNLVATLTSYLLNDQMPSLTADGRPTFCHGSTIHSQCPAPKGCMEGYNCKGKVTRNNCPKQLFNEESWCLAAEHQCIGCSEPGFWDAHAPFYNSMWASMFATYRSRAVSHPVNPAAFCTPCHGSSTYSNQRNARGTKFALYGHDKHKLDSSEQKISQVLNTNKGCANCHTAPGGTKEALDD